jgi:hypothetical protein
MTNARVFAILAFGTLLAGCPLAMRDDYVVESEGIGEPDRDAGAVSADSGAAPPIDAGTVPIDAPPPCVPTTCLKVGAQCGSLADGCGATLDCGVCKPDKVCGVRMPNHCDK